MVRDKRGRKMSKSLGNVIDPLEVINGVSLIDLLAKLDAGNIEAKELVMVRYIYNICIIYLCIYLYSSR